MTGSNYCLESGGHKILIDCGLFQGTHYAEGQNFEPFRYEPRELSALFVTHPHLDHVGRIPKLFADGFGGKVYSTFPARDLAELALIDSEHILGKEAEREGRPPIYVASDVAKAMASWEGVNYHVPVTVGPFTVTFYNAGHTLGSAFILVEVEGKRIVFSGDLGNSPAPLLPPTEPLVAADYCLIESTYGDRVHVGVDERRGALEDAIEDTVKAGGVLMIPAFALERTQEILFHLDRLSSEGRIPHVPVFIDSPLAIKMTAVYKKYKSYLNAESSRLISMGDDILHFPGLKFTLETEASKAINAVPAPKVIIAGSGMSHGGRILHHERRYLPDPKSTLLIVGYQAQGSLGRRLLDGAQSVVIMREEVPVAAKIRFLSGYSAHADQPRLLAWLKPQRMALKKVFVVQGEEHAALALQEKIRDELAIPASVPKAGEVVVL